MLEMKITINVPDLSEAINKLAEALSNSGSLFASTPAKGQTKTETVTKNTSSDVQSTPSTVNTTLASVPVYAPVSPNTSVPVSNVPLAEPPQYTVDQIMVAGAALMDAGKVNELLELLHSFGVQAVMDLKPDQLGAFATAMRGLGAKI